MSNYNYPLCKCSIFSTVTSIFWVLQTHLLHSDPCSGQWLVLCLAPLLSGLHSSVHSHSCMLLHRFRRPHNHSCIHKLLVCSSCPCCFWCTPVQSHSGAQLHGVRHRPRPLQRHRQSSSRSSPALNQFGSPPVVEGHTKLAHMVHIPELLEQEGPTWMELEAE